jgi:hypothetical protein
MKLHLIIVPLAAAWLLSVPALAAGAADQAAAEALFNEAKKLVAAGDFEHACPKFAESNRLDPGSGTLLNLGACYEQTGKLASAWGAFNEAAVTARNAGDANRQEEATRRAAALAPRLPKLTVIVTPSARVPGFEVRRDGELVGEGQWGSPIPTDPGRHKIEATAAGFKPWSTLVQVDMNAASASIAVPPLEKLAAEPDVTSQAHFWNAQRVAGIAIGGVGVVGVVVGGIFGGITLSKAGASKSHCAPDLSTCDATGGQLQHDAHTTANVSNATFAIGGAALIAGIVTFAVAPRGGTTSPQTTAYLRIRPSLSMQMNGVTLQGEW